jgi:hypothetical protein
MKSILCFLAGFVTGYAGFLLTLYALGVATLG